MNPNQINSLVRSALKLAGMALMTHGCTAMAQIINCEDTAGLVVLLVSLWLSHQAHDTAPAPASAPASPSVTPPAGSGAAANPAPTQP